MSGIVRVDGMPWPNGSLSFEFTTPLELNDVVTYADAAGNAMHCRIIEQRGSTWAAAVIEAGESTP